MNGRIASSTIAASGGCERICVSGNPLTARLSALYLGAERRSGPLRSDHAGGAGTAEKWALSRLSSRRNDIVLVACLLIVGGS
jgi:hypothetical protein